MFRWGWLVECQNISRGTLISTGIARDLLTDAFSKLPNLRIVGLRDYDGKGRDRDDEGDRKGAWRSYGWSMGLPDPEERDYGVLGSIDRHITRGPSNDIFTLLLFALGLAAAKPRKLEVFLRQQPLSSFAFDVSGIMAAKCTPVLKELKTLLLTLEDRSSDRRLHALQDVLQQPQLHEMQAFLQQTPLLEHLRLNFKSGRGKEAGEFLQWLSLPSGSNVPGPTSKATPPVQLGYLTRLDLGMLTAECQTLVNTVAKFPNLESFSIWKVSITPTAGSDDGSSEQWPLFLSKLADTIKQADRIMGVSIGWASQLLSGGSLEIVQFADKVTIDANGEKRFESPDGKATYRKHVGSDVREWLRSLAERAHIPKMLRSRRGTSATTDEDDESEDINESDDTHVSDGSSDTDTDSEDDEDDD